MAITLQERCAAVFYAPFYVALARDAYATGGRRRCASSARRRPASAAQGLFGRQADVCWGGPMRVMQAYAAMPACDLVCFAEVVTRDPFLLLGARRAPGFHGAGPVGLRVGTVSEVPTPWMCLQDDLRLRRHRSGAARYRLPTAAWPTTRGAAARRVGRGAGVRTVRLRITGGRWAGIVWYAAGQPRADRLHLFLCAAGTLRDACRGTAWHGARDLPHPEICGRCDGAKDRRHDSPAFSRTCRRRCWLRLARATRRLASGARDPVLPRAGYDRLRASLLSGGFVSPGDPVRGGGGQQPGGRPSSRKIRRRSIEIKGGNAMPHATADDGVHLYYEETGTGIPVIFVHEYAGDYRSWEPQMRHFGQRYRAIAFRRARLSAVRRAGGRGEVLADPRGRRHRRRARPPVGSTRRMWWGCRWAGSPRCISASAIRGARAR